MGRIKSTMVKGATKKLLKSENVFSSDFENNKKLLKNTMPSKSIRNKIAGYISRLMRVEEAEKSKE